VYIAVIETVWYCSDLIAVIESLKQQKIESFLCKRWSRESNMVQVFERTNNYCNLEQPNEMIIVAGAVRVLYLYSKKK